MVLKLKNSNGVTSHRTIQVSFLHVYHHVSIAWAWWYALYAWPGGDAYFGALLNSIIHVMMYSYYTLSLCKISCPWKRYLTQAQLLQFTSVVIYTGCCTHIHIKQQDLETKHVWCLIVQFIEMTSMFVLFMHFYSKAYKSKKSKKMSEPVPSELESVSSDSSDEAATKKDL
jgi:elongation of very long chain fatty acids protein 4